MIKTTLFLFSMLFSIFGFAQLIPQIGGIPDYFTAQQKDTFINNKNLLLKQKDSLISHAGELKAKCGNVRADDDKLNNECKAEQAQVQKEKRDLIDAINQYNDVIRIINSMNTLAKKLGWSKKKQEHFIATLIDLQADGKGTRLESVKSWSNVLARGQSKEFADEASLVNGLGLPSAGKQSHNDCAIYALSNATGVPYTIVAARAAELIREGKWRSAEQLANPQKTMEDGLIGGEVVMLAEDYGIAEIISSNDFAKTLKEGHPVMVNMVPSNGDFRQGHEVVLTKTFLHKGQTWFEMIDSNQEGNFQRLYLSKEELQTMIQEMGVSYRPEKGTVPKLLP